MKLLRRRLHLALPLLVAVAYLVGPGGAQSLGLTSGAHWDRGFDDRAPQGVVGEVAVYDDGSGLRIAYEDTYFTLFAKTPDVFVTIADPKTSGSVQYYVSSPCSFCGEVAEVNALLPYDDGSGPRLLLGGAFAFWLLGSRE